MSETKTFKEYFDAALVDELAASLAAASPTFDEATFRELATDGLEDLEMMPRVKMIAAAMEAALPGTTAERMGWLIATFPPLQPWNDETDDTAEPISGGFGLWPIGEFIGRTGLDDFSASFDAMIELTQRFSSEFAVRPFLEADPVAALDRLEALINHESHHVRRWVSEGTRTRLPWATKIDALLEHQHRRLEFLKALRLDDSRYVQRSVANHLQDIIKDDEALGVQVVQDWASEGHESTDWIVRHASRNLLKAGHPAIMEVFGYPPGLVDVLEFSASPDQVSTGDSIALKVVFKNESDQSASVRLDYAMECPTKTGKVSRKVFRWADRTLAPGEAATIHKSYDVVHRSTRRVYPGTFSFTPLLNSEAGPVASVTVVVP